MAHLQDADSVGAANPGHLVVRGGVPASDPFGGALALGALGGALALGALGELGELGGVVAAGFASGGVC